ncbi:MAG: DUF3786 domain-containing protein [Chloroflexota bacterium]
MPDSTTPSSPAPAGQASAAHPEAERLEQRFAQRVGELRARLESLDPAAIAQHSGATITRFETGGQLELSLWDRPLAVTFPGFTVRWTDTGDGANPFDQALVLYYLSTADGAPLLDGWVSFADLPDGRFYVQAFNGYTGQELAKAFGDDRFAFEQAAQQLGGEPFALGDAAYRFLPLPRAPLAVVYWQGDEDFPASCQLLFNTAASHYLPTDAYAILGSTLTRRLIRRLAR